MNRNEKKNNWNWHSGTAVYSRNLIVTRSKFDWHQLQENVLLILSRFGVFHLDYVCLRDFDYLILFFYSSPIFIKRWTG